MKKMKHGCHVLAQDHTWPLKFTWGNKNHQLENSQSFDQIYKPTMLHSFLSVRMDFLFVPLEKNPFTSAEDILPHHPLCHQFLPDAVRCDGSGCAGAPCSFAVWSWASYLTTLYLDSSVRQGTLCLPEKVVVKIKWINAHTVFRTVTRILQVLNKWCISSII